MPGLDGPQLPHNPVDTLLRPKKTKLLRALPGTYCHPHHVQLSPYSSRLLTMLTTPEGGAAASKPRRRTMVRPRMGTNKSRGRSQPVVGGRSRRSRRRWFGFGGSRKKILKNTIDVECQSNGQGWHNRFWLSGHKVAYFFIYRKKTARKMRSSTVLLRGNVRHISD